MLARTRVFLVGLASLAYVAGSHWLMTQAADSAWSATALLAPMLGLIAFLAWRGRQWALCAVALAVLAGLALHAAIGGAVSQRALFLGQHVVIHLGLAALFGTSLRPGAQALISRVAQSVHGVLAPAMARYTRHVTLAWTIYFIVMVVLSLAVYALAPFEAWAAFANWLTPLALAAMFGGEHLLRYRLHPEFERVSMVRAIQAYSQRHAAVPTGADLRGTGGATEPR
jgi:uncharacterized membrane protein